MREFLPEDAPYFCALNNDWEVMKYTGDKAFTDEEDALNLILNYTDYKKNGFGRCTVVLKESNEVIGWCGLKRHLNKEVDLGYRLLRRYWNKGYATEASLKILDHGFKEYGLEEVVGHVSPLNGASIRIFEKCGFRFVKRDDYEDFGDCLHYIITKEEFYA
ncbi:MAG: GNAT family N-acetyltransferase [Crocinitomicaceae bacterium]|nr:GNAT family N-acetyltransferase [Crocinitomicaceae bacterium]